MGSKKQKDKDEYYFLGEKLEEINWALEGNCDDIDCDKYMYKDLLKKKYNPVLEHNFSCIDKLKRNKAAVMRLLSQKKFQKYRYEKCNVCKKKLDKLDEKNTIVSFTRPSIFGGKKTYELNMVWAHHKCSKKVKIPKGWENFLNK